MHLTSARVFACNSLSARESATARSARFLAACERACAAFTFTPNSRIRCARCAFVIAGTAFTIFMTIKRVPAVARSSSRIGNLGAAKQIRCAATVTS